MELYLLNKSLYILYFGTALPSLTQPLPDANILVNETLDVSCVISAKPVATIAWVKEPGTVPNTTILNIATTTEESGIYDITTSRMTWNTPDYNLRKTVSGIYTCSANNGYNDFTEQMELNIECKMLFKMTSVKGFGECTKH